MTEMIGHVAETAGHDGPKRSPVTMDRNPRSRCRNHWSRWSEIPSQAFPAQTDLNKIKAYIVEKLRIRVDAVELAHPDGRVLVFEVPSRPVGQPLDFEGAFLMRAGEDLVPMTPDYWLNAVLHGT